MIQRKQSIWLLLAALAGFGLSQVPIFKGTLANNTVTEIIATGSLLLFALAMATACLAAVSIFLFKNRSLQFKLAIVGVLLSVALVALEVWQVEAFKTKNVLAKGTYYWGGLLPVMMVLFFILAARGIYKDEKLVKSLDRLR